MEDIARLALVEQSLRDVDNFSKILYELLHVVNQILDNPYDYDLRTIRSDVLKKVLTSEALIDYLKYIGFRLVGNDFAYPKEQTLGKLRIAQAAIERKLYFCCGSLHRSQRKVKSSHSIPHVKKVKFAPTNILNTKSPLLLKIEVLFNSVLKYENEDLQELAREHIPLVTLQLMALDRVREQQRQLKTSTVQAHDLTFEIALLLELLEWFKYRFFSWVDRPECPRCQRATRFTRTVQMVTETETCTVEIYQCMTCNSEIDFPRFNDPRKLLQTRRGRCGEWANCFALMCRALGYDTRYVYDVTDHVWCEIFDMETNSWLHVDPCECKLDTPLMYAHGWGKQLSYVIAISRDDVQDVTWRYTMDHKQVLKRRNLCTESDLIGAIIALREHRQKQVSEPRRRYLAKRTLQELAQLMVERKPNEYEADGRISGAIEWRVKRGEVGAKKHVFLLTEPGTYDVLYYTALDKYRIERDGNEIGYIDGWGEGAYESENIFRKVEQDWDMVYLAREEGSPTGSISWCVATAEGLVCNSLGAQLVTALYENGQIDWTVEFDDEEPETAHFGESWCTVARRFSGAVVRGELRGGGGAGWQRAQVARQPRQATQPAWHLRLTVETTTNHY